MSPRTIPEPGKVPNVSQDALQAYQTLKSGGVIIAPTDVGYALITSTQAGINRIFAAKGRRRDHNIGIIGTYQQHREIHLLPESKFEMTRVLTEDMGMIVGIIAKFDSKNLHPRLAALDKDTLAQVTKGDTVSIAVPEGPFLRELGRLCDADPEGMLMFGTSANLTGQGQRFRVEDVEPAVVACVDLVVDYGLQKWHVYGRGGVNFDAENMQVLRMGAGYEIFRERILRWFPQLLAEASSGLEEDPEHRIKELQTEGSNGLVKE
jgi:tRNA A37 threonylcarbamoyladenosine synthetase subunit TsaC/SUA5/YrdC